MGAEAQRTHGVVRGHERKKLALTVPNVKILPIGRAQLKSLSSAANPPHKSVLP